MVGTRLVKNRGLDGFNASRFSRGVIGFWCLIGGVLLSADAAFDDSEFMVHSPIHEAPRWMIDCAGKALLVGGGLLLFGLLWRGKDLRPGIVARKAAWTLLAAGGAALTGMVGGSPWNDPLTMSWATGLCLLSLGQMAGEIAWERKAYQIKDHHRAIVAIGDGGDVECLNCGK